jgi:methylthioribose-1-phosphate isomerase
MMRDLIANSIRYENGSFHILDQTKLPNVEEWIKCSTVDEFVSIVLTLKVRGAPAIGISASIMVAHLSKSNIGREELKEIICKFKSVRPTAVNLMNNLDQMEKALSNDNYKESLINTAERLFYEDVALCNEIAEKGVKLLKYHQNILTHCNTGSLATVGIGTALGVIQRKNELYGSTHVFVDETRPLLQGARLTAWELSKLGIDHTLICDSMAAFLMQQQKIDCVVVGADRIAINGDFANKIGTYSLAVLAHYHKIPFYVVAPYTTIDLECNNAIDIDIELRKSNEVRGYNNIIWSPKNVDVYNPAFDTTPAELITAWILNDGIYNNETFSKYARSN